MTRKRLEVQSLNSLRCHQVGDLRSSRRGADSAAFIPDGICIRLGVLAILAILLIGTSCHDPYTTNPNLVQLYSNPSYAAFNPVPSHDGRTIYFLADSADAKSGDYNVFYSSWERVRSC